MTSSARRRTIARRARADARFALRRFGLPTAPLEYLGTSQNAVVRAGHHLVRIGANDRTREEAASEILWLDALRDHGVRVPTPHRRANGSSFVEWTTGRGFRRATVFDWIEGEELDWASEGAIVGAATLLRSLHDQARSWTPPPGFERWRNDVVRVDDGSVLDPCSEARHAVAIEEFDRWLGPEAARGASAGLARFRQAVEGIADWGALLIHGDFHSGNLLHSPGGAVVAIDFDDCGWGHALLDLAAVAVDFRHCEVVPRLPEFWSAYGETPDTEILAAVADLRRIMIAHFVADQGWKARNPSELDWARNELLR